MLRAINKRLLSLTCILLLFALLGLTSYAAGVYTVKSGDSLWTISRANGISVSQLKSSNSLSSDTIYIGQKLTLSQAVKYTVKSGDSLWSIAKNYSSSAATIKSYNGLSSEVIYPGQVLYIPSGTSAGVMSASYTATAEKSWPSITYIVKAGDTVGALAKKFGVSSANIIKYNYMDPEEWLDEGEKIAINGYAPRYYAVTPGESAYASRVGKLVDWFYDGKYLIKRNDIFTITDVKTGYTFTVKMLGGINHSDVEPLTASDTAIMKKLFSSWTWNPRPVVVFHQGINFAASLSGMPHSYDSISSNNVSGHFDLYFYNSKGHGADVSAAYVQQHQACVLVAAGK